DVMQATMAEASGYVLRGFRLRSETKVIRHPERYVDGRGAALWQTVLDALNLGHFVPPCCILLSGLLPSSDSFSEVIPFFDSSGQSPISVPRFSSPAFSLPAHENLLGSSI